MDADHAARLTLAIGRLVKAFPRQAIPVETGAVYVEELADLPIRVVEEAVRRLIRTGTFFPVIAEIRAGAAEVLDPFPAWEQAWEEINRAIRRYGCYGVPNGPPDYGYREVDWSCRPVAEAVAAMGYQALCESENEPADRAHFRQVYEACRARAVEVHQVGPLLPARTVPALESGAPARIGVVPIRPSEAVRG